MENEKKNKNLGEMLTDLRSYLITIIVTGAAWAGILPALVKFINELLQESSPNINANWYQLAAYAYFLSPLLVYIGWRLTKRVTAIMTKVRTEGITDWNSSHRLKDLLLTSKFRHRRRDNASIFDFLRFGGILSLIFLIGVIIWVTNQADLGDTKAITDLSEDIFRFWDPTLFIANYYVLGFGVICFLMTYLLIYRFKPLEEPNKLVKLSEMSLFFLMIVGLILISTIYYSGSKSDIKNYTRKGYDAMLLSDSGIRSASVGDIAQKTFRFYQYKQKFEKDVKDELNELEERFIGRAYMALASDTLYNDWTISDSIQTRRFKKRVVDTAKTKKLFANYKLAVKAHQSGTKPDMPSLPDTAYCFHCVKDSLIDDPCQKLDSIFITLNKFNPGISYCSNEKDTSLLDTLKGYKNIREINKLITATSDELCEIVTSDDKYKSRKVVSLIGKLDNLEEAGEVVHQRHHKLYLEFLPLLITSTGSVN